ncbi:MAG: hypothetical protein AB8B63_00925 [Granulosicoccus sp.]
MRGYAVMPLDDDFPVIDINTSGDQQSFHIGPGQKASADVVIQQDGNFDFIESGGGCIAVGFKIEYKDVFGDFGDITEFAMRFHLMRTYDSPNGPVKVFGGVADSPNFTYSEQGNQPQEIRRPATGLG